MNTSGLCLVPCKICIDEYFRRELDLGKHVLMNTSGLSWILDANISGVCWILGNRDVLMNTSGLSWILRKSGGVEEHCVFLRGYLLCRVPEGQLKLPSNSATQNPYEGTTWDAAACREGFTKPFCELQTTGT